MSGRSGSKTPATIKIAPKDASQRTGTGGADPGPGDPNAEPSQAPELIDIPQPPTPSELVVKSGTNSRVIKTINDPVSLPKSSHLSASNKGASSMGSKSKSASNLAGSGSSIGASGSNKGASASNMGASASNMGASGSNKGASSQIDPAIAAAASNTAADLGAARESTSSKALGRSGSDKPRSVSGSHKSTSPASAARFNATSGASGVVGPSSGRTASATMQAGSQPGASVHDEVEEGEGEMEHPSDSPSPSGGSGAGPGISPRPSESDLAAESPSGGMDTAPASSGGGASKMSPKTSSYGKSSAASTPEASEASDAHGKKKKKVTKFRYHKRITVRTHGKTSPSTIMDKVAKKEHKAGITPSTIEDMDPHELMRRAGIKNGHKKAHWRVRLRQTKRMTKNGKTVVQTKVAYRDSEGNKRVKTASGPNCKNCGKKLEECKCD